VRPPYTDEATQCNHVLKIPIIHGEREGYPHLHASSTMAMAADIVPHRPTPMSPRYGLVRIDGLKLPSEDKGREVSRHHGRRPRDM
jgi:hypothetical protein